MKKRILSILLATALAVSCLAGCGGKKAEVAGESLSSTVDWNEDPDTYPIVNEPITLKVGVSVGSVSQGDWNDLDWVKELEKQSGINLEFVVYQNTEAVNLMFTSQDYPDIAWGLGKDKQIADAAAGGALYAWDDYMEKYAPNWDKYLKENENVRKTISNADGKVYSLPMIRDEYYNYAVRDQWLIQKSWLDELGLQVPTTTDEFYNVLKAFKANAGKGSIPEDAIPYYTYGILNNVGGALDVFNSYGIRLVATNHMVTLDDKGKVEFNYTNEAIKEPIKFLNKLVNEGLIPKESFTDSWDTYLTKIKATTPTVGCYHAYTNMDDTGLKTVPMAPLDTGNGETPIIRSQDNVVQKNYFTIFKTCKYPEIAARLANMIAEEDWSVQASYGMIGGEETTVSKAEDGTYIVDEGDGTYEGLYVPGERVAYLITKDLHEKIKMEPTAKNYPRQQAVENIYAKYTMGTEHLYPTFILSDENIDRVTELELDISNYIKTTFAEWIMYGGVDEGWDDYIKQMKAYGVDEYLEILQDELDAYNAK